MPASIPQSVRRFVASHITAVWQLELLFLFKHSKTALSAADASKHLYLSADVLQPAIKRFCDTHILLQTQEDATKYIYAPTQDELRTAIDELESCYSQRRVAVINLIFGGTMQTFADAFKFMREEDEQ